MLAMQMRGLIACLLGFGAIGTFLPLSAQVTARQATPAENPKQHFESPMILEIPFPKILDIPKGSLRGIGVNLRNFVCEDTHLAGLSIERGRTRGKGDEAVAHFEFHVTARVGSTRDKEVVLLFTLVSGEQVLFKARSKRFEVEEERSASTQVKFNVPVTKLEESYRREEGPILKIMMSVWDD